MKLTAVIIIALIAGFKLYGVYPAFYKYEPLQVNTVTPTPTPKVSEVVGEIARVFEPEGKGVVKQAIDIFFCESGWRWDAAGNNKNGTRDGGVSQINDIHRISWDDRMDYKKNIEAAYKIYKRWNNFGAWVCARNLGYAK
jgi:hypothetical protein